MFAKLTGLKTVSPNELHGLMQNSPVTVIGVNSAELGASPGPRRSEPGPG
jgi:hypothetical protein